MVYILDWRRQSYLNNWDYSRSCLCNNRGNKGYPHCSDTVHSVGRHQPNFQYDSTHSTCYQPHRWQYMAYTYNCQLVVLSCHLGRNTSCYQPLQRRRREEMRDGKDPRASFMTKPVKLTLIRNCLGRSCDRSAVWEFRVVGERATGLGGAPPSFV